VVGVTEFVKCGMSLFGRKHQNTHDLYQVQLDLHSRLHPGRLQGPEVLSTDLAAESGTCYLVPGSLEDPPPSDKYVPYHAPTSLLRFPPGGSLLYLVPRIE
jgi:hypothetical protein